MGKMVAPGIHVSPWAGGIRVVAELAGIIYHLPPALESEVQGQPSLLTLPRSQAVEGSGPGISLPKCSPPLGMSTAGAPRMPG